MLLTESSQMQSIQMKKLLERTGQPIPHALQEMVDVSLRVRTNTINTFPIHVRTFGPRNIFKMSFFHVSVHTHM